MTKQLALPLLALIILVTVALLTPQYSSSSDITEPSAEDYSTPLEFYRAGHAPDASPFTYFTVQLADTPKLMQTGLMHRTSMPDNNGMLFTFPQSDIIRMWMKNTHIALDMIFMDEQGIVRHIVTHTTPFSTKTISSQEKSRYVLEINAGMSDKRGIKIGDRIKLTTLRPSNNPQ